MNPLFSPVSSLIAAMLPEHPRWSDTVGYQINGLIVVFLALGLIWGALELTGLYFKRASLTARPVEPGHAAPPSGDISPETMAVIAAAVQTKLGQPHRIQAVMPVASPQKPPPAQGR